MEARQDQAAAAEGAAAGGGSAPARGQAGSTALPTEYASAADLVRGELGAGRSVHLECSRAAMRAAREAVQEVAGARRAAFYLEDDGGFDRDTVRSYLRFFARLAGDGAAAAAGKEA